MRFDHVATRRRLLEIAGAGGSEHVVAVLPVEAAEPGRHIERRRRLESGRGP
jgi:hypothetical protein